MKKIVLFGIVLSFAMVLSAQQNDKSKEILQQASKKTQSYSTISAAFSFTMENKKEGINEANKGTIQLKGKKYRVELPEMGLQIFSDGVAIWNCMRDANEVSINNAGGGNTDLLDPSTIFQVYEKGFASKFVEEKTVAGNVFYVIDLSPENNQIEFSKIRVMIDKTNLMIHSAVMDGKDGNTYKIEISKLETNKPVDDSSFVFDVSKHPGVEKIDYR